jgi:hypothetical protein
LRYDGIFSTFVRGIDMRRENVVAFDAELQRAATDFKIQLSPVARELLYGIVDAITRDPHPSWRENERQADNLDQAQRAMIGRIVNELKNFPTPQVTAFDLLHSVSEIVDRLCPFHKVPR